jgi:hypothetical protein
MARLHTAAPAPTRTSLARALVLGAALVAPIVGCGGGDADDFDAPTCAAGEVAIEGTIDGGQESASLSGATGYSFVNAINGELGSLTVTFEAGDRLHLEWPDLVANGDAVDARGTVAFPGLDLGNCEDDGFPGTLRMDPEGDGGSFRLPSLHPGADCAAAEVSGELTGCFASSSS